MTLTPLAPLDYVFTGNMACPVTFAFAYSEQLDPKRLQQSLELLVTRNPLLGGKLRVIGSDALAYETSDRPVLELELATATAPLGELTVAEAVRPVRSEDGGPLVTARLTQTPNGSILGVSMSHALVDGFSFFLTLSRWAACTRGEQFDDSPVTRLLRASEEQVGAIGDLTPRALLEQSGLFWRARRREQRMRGAQERTRLRAEALAELMQSAQADVDAKLRENDVLTAWLWRKYGRQWWAGRGNPTVYMSCPVDVRRLLGDENRFSFGCTICCATAEATFEELAKVPLGQLALRIQRSVAAVFEGGFESRVASLEMLRRRHGLQAMESLHFRHPNSGMLVTNMSRLPLAELDFGCGAPIDFKLYSGFDSMAAVLPARDGVDLSVYRPTASPARAWPVQPASAASRRV